MAMRQNRAFNRRMLTRLVRYKKGDDYYNDDNDFIKGQYTKEVFYGVSVAGNKFSQFDEGIALIATTGGERFSNYRSLYVEDRWPEMVEGDKILYRDTFYNILQKSDERDFGFHSYLIEKSTTFGDSYIGTELGFIIGDEFGNKLIL